MTFGTDARRNLTIGLILTLGSLAQAKSDLIALEAYPADAQGGRFQPKVGESTFLALRFRVTGANPAPYRVAFRSPYATLQTPVLHFGRTPGDYTVVWGPLPLPMDGAVKIQAELDPDRRVRDVKRSNNVISLNLVPRTPETALEYFAPRLLEGEQALSLSWAPGSAAPSRVVLALPQPTSRPGQELVSAEAPEFQDEPADPFDTPVWVRALNSPGLQPVLAQSRFRVWSWSTRVNRAQLRLGRFSDYSPQRPELAAALRPETWIESTHKDIVGFTLKSLPRGYSSKMSPAEAAERLYLALLKRSSYRYVPGEVPSALAVLKRGKGDCGGLSSLFVAMCRAAGIPARSVVGMHQAELPWHVWAEFYDPQAGWVPVDPAFAEGLGAKGDLPLYFGVLPEGNQRIAVGEGLDRRLDGMTLPMLQSPALQWWGAGVRLGRFETTGSVRPVE